MKKLYSSVAIAMLSASAGAQLHTLEETIVTASPHAKKGIDIAGAVNVLEGVALQQAAAATLGETLKNQLGVNSSSFGVGVGVPVIRGQSGKRVANLQNGLLIGDVSATSFDHAVATEALLAERIEILRGPATLRYGSGAIGGVVNVIDNRIHTQQFEGTEGAIEARHNTNNDESVVVARFDAGLSELNFHFDAVTRESNNVEINGLADPDVDDLDETTDGYIANSDREADAFTAGVAWVGENVSTGFSIHQLDNNYGIPGHSHEDHGHGHGGGAPVGGHAAEEVDVRIDVEQTVYQGKLQIADLGGIWQQLNIDLGVTNYEHDELEIGDEVEVGTSFELDSQDLRVELTHESYKGWLGAVGLQYSQRDFAAQGEEAFLPGSDTENLGLFITEAYEKGDMQYELGFRVDQQSLSTPGINDIEHDTFNFSVSALKSLNEQHRVGLIISSAERAPVAEELLSDGEHVAVGVYEIGDTTLDNEKSFNIELSWVYQGAFDATVSVYHNQFSDYIYQHDTELLFNEDVAMAINMTGLAACTDEAAFHTPQEAEEAVECFVWRQQGADFTGIEAEAVFTIDDINSLRVWGDSVRASFDDGTDVPRIPAARMGAAYQYEHNRWSAELNLLKVLEQDRAGENQSSTDAYSSVDASVAYTQENWRAFIKGNNLTNEQIRHAASFTRDVAPEPGRGFELGFRYFF